MVSNLVVEIAIYNFDLFHSALVLTLSLRLLSFAEKGESVVEVGVAENEKQFFLDC